MAKKVYYRCETCRANIPLSLVRAFGARCLCPRCYAAEIQLALAGAAN